MALYASKAIKGGPYDSTKVVEEINGFPKGDKAIDAAFIASMIDSLITSGVVNENGHDLEVTSGEALTVKVSPGVAWARGYMARLDEEVIFELEPGGEYKIYIRQDTLSGEATINVQKDGSDGVPVRSSSIYDLVLATVSIPDGAEFMTDGMITDRRDAPTCGYVASRI